MAEVKANKKLEDWELDSKVDTLINAIEIINDKTLMKAIDDRISKKQKAVNSIADLRKLANSKPKGNG